MTDSILASEWEHDHSFGQDQRRDGEQRTLLVIAVTTVMMLAEIVAGVLYGSMALLADGLHMASHAAALTVSAFAYIYARRHAHDRQFSFGTGKVNSLGGFTGAVLLAVFALIMTWESVARLLQPVEIAYGQAISVAVLGFIVNVVSVLILGHDGHHGHDDHHVHGNDDGVPHAHTGEHHDHNLRAAYLHVLADALTSILAIFALLAARYFDAVWMDPMMGIVGAVLISYWSLGLLRTTGRVLLDRQAPDKLCSRIRECLESDTSCRVVDLHIWTIGPRIYAAAVSIAATTQKPLDVYRSLLSSAVSGIVHTTIEVQVFHSKDSRPKTDKAEHVALTAEDEE